jgi:integrase
MEEAREFVDQVSLDLERAERPMSAAELAIARRVTAMLPAGVDLLDLWKHYAATHPSLVASVTVGEARARYLDLKGSANLRRRSLADIRMFMERLEPLDGVAVNQVASVDLTALIPEDASPVTRNNYRTYWGGLFAWAMMEGLCARNPVDGIPAARIEAKPASILSLEQVEKLLGLVLELEHRVLLPYVAIGLFAGVRPDEMKLMEWGRHVQGDHLHLTPDVTKTRRTRFVDRSPALDSFLALVPRREGMVVAARGGEFRERFEALRDALGVVPWPADCLRHSFASYHLARGGDATTTAHQLGHSNTTMLFRHYRNLVSAEDAAAFWALRVETVGRTLAESGNSG